MTRASVLYPNSEGCESDIAWCRNSHGPAINNRLGDDCKGQAADQGIGGGAPGSRSTDVAAGHRYCESVGACQAAFGPHAKEIMADIPNHTDVRPVLVIRSILIKTSRGHTGEPRLHAA